MISLTVHVVEPLAASSPARWAGVPNERPYDSLVADHRDLTCGMNLAWAEGVVDGLGVRDVRVELESEPGRCCVVFHSEPGRREA